MRRITISLDDDLARLAEAEVSAGRASSVSAWVADAIRAKAQARADLVADLEELERRAATSPETVSARAPPRGLPRTAGAQALKGTRQRRGRPRATGRRG